MLKSCTKRLFAMAVTGLMIAGVARAQEKRDIVPDKWGEDYLYSSITDDEKGIISASLPMRVRIAQDVEVLSRESLKESLSLLSEIEMFYWPGAPGGESDISFPLQKEEGTRLVDAILSNRRFLKLLFEFNALPKTEAAEMINVEIRATLPVYLEMFEDTWSDTVANRASSPVEGLAAYGAGPSMRISNNADHSPTLLGARNKIMSLLIIAGNLNLTETLAEVSKVIAAAIDQREVFYSTHEALEADRFCMLSSAGLYNRQILTSVLLGVKSAGEWTDDESWETYELVVYL